MSIVPDLESPLFSHRGANGTWARSWKFLNCKRNQCPLGQVMLARKVLVDKCVWSWGFSGGLGGNIRLATILRPLSEGGLGVGTCLFPTHGKAQRPWKGVLPQEAQPPRELSGFSMKTFAKCYVDSTHPEACVPLCVCLLHSPAGPVQAA